MPNQPQEPAHRFSVYTRVHLRWPDKDPEVVDDDVTYTPETWPEAVEELRKEVQQRFDESHCLLADKRIPESRRSRKEHVIPEASGIKWIKVPPGFVDDDINNRLSYYEKELFQKGDMGTLRPYYLRKGIIPADFTEGEKSVEIGNQAGKGFFIVLKGFDELDLTGGKGGVLSLTVPVDQPQPLHVSRALHKMALLTFCVRHPSLAFHPSLAPCRRYIVEGREEDFRPFGETFCPGHPPSLDSHAQLFT